MANVREPIETMLTPMMPCFASSPQTRNCSRSSPAKSGLRMAAADDRRGQRRRGRHGPVVADERDPVSRHGVFIPRLRLPLPIQYAL